MLAGGKAAVYIFCFEARGCRRSRDAAAASPSRSRSVAVGRRDATHASARAVLAVRGIVRRAVTRGAGGDRSGVERGALRRAARTVFHYARFRALRGPRCPACDRARPEITRVPRIRQRAGSPPSRHLLFNRCGGAPRSVSPRRRARHVRRAGGWPPLAVRARALASARLVSPAALAAPSVRSQWF